MSDLQRYIARQSADSPEFTRLRAESQADHDREVRRIRAKSRAKHDKVVALCFVITGYIVVALVKLLM